MEHRNSFESSLRNPIWRLRIIAGGFVLLALTFAQRPGRIVGDTKAGLVLDPGGYLATALSIWDPNGSWGQVQNQAYGYLWPMGSFFWLGDLAGLPDWIVQRLWWFTLLFTAYLGMIVLLNALRLGRPWMHILAGFAFALSPRMLGTIGPTSIEVWPLAVAPWVLAPLVLAVTSRRDPKWMAAASAFAVAMVGGVNAAATFAVIPLAAIWIVMAPPGRVRRTLMLWWPPFVLMGTLWWIIPLFVLGSVSPPFLDFIEGAQATHEVTTFIDALRGTSHWVTYIDPTSQAGSALIRNPVVMLNSFVVLGLGLAGLVLAPKRIRSFLWVGLFIGSFLITAGFEGNAFSEAVRVMLDGPLAPLRNSHKFDPVVRIVLVVGLVALLDTLPSPKGTRITPKFGISTVAIVAVFGASIPAWTGLLSNYGTYQEVPQYWSRAADWLNAREDDGNVFILPGSIVAEHLWGSPKDEVFESYLDRPWTVRMANPLVPPANIKTIDEIERIFASGRGSDALAHALANQNVRYIVVRADLNTRGPSSEYWKTLSTLSEMPNVREVRSFGPVIGLPPNDIAADGRRVFFEHGMSQESRAIRIFEVSGAERTSSLAYEDTPILIGEPSALFNSELARPGFAAILSGDVTPALPVKKMPTILTDTHILRETSFGRVIENRSASMTSNEEFALKRRVYDFEIGGEKSVRRLIGAESIRASSSGSQVNAAPIRVDRSPWSAFDGDPMTSWTANTAQEPEQAWLEVRFAQPVALDGAKLLIGQDVRTPYLFVETDQGRSSIRVSPGATVDLGQDGVKSATLKVIGKTSRRSPFSISELTIPSVSMSRPLVLPATSKNWRQPQALLLQADKPESNCFRVENVLRCSPKSVSIGEEHLLMDRIIPWSTDTIFPMKIIAEPLPTGDLDDSFSGDVRVRASSRLANNVASGPLAMLDGNTKTGWIAGTDDFAATINLEFDTARMINRIGLFTDIRLPASMPTQVEISFDDGSKQTVNLDPYGEAEISPRETASLRVKILEYTVRRNITGVSSAETLPPGVSELMINRGSLGPNPDERVEIPCGGGPTVEVNGSITRTSLVSTLKDVIDGKPIEAKPCSTGSVALKKGENRLLIRASDLFRTDYMLLGEVPETVKNAAESESNGHQITAKSLDSESDLVFIAQNINPGWVSDSDSVAVNGWMQGWQSSTIAANFRLETLYRAGILGGGLLAVSLMIINLAYLRSRPSTDDGAPGFSSNRMFVFIGVLLLPFVAGWLGLAAGVSAGLIATRWQRIGWLIASGTFTVVAGAYVLTGFAADGSWAGSLFWLQWISSACVGALAGLALDPNEKSFNRRIGSSRRR